MLDHDSFPIGKLNFYAYSVLGYHPSSKKISSTNEVSHERVCWTQINLVRSTNLLNAPLVHYNDAIRNSQCLSLVMSDIKTGYAQIFLNAADMLARFYAQLGVKVRKRLIKQQNLWFNH